jgi:hypothetical protein
MKTTVAFLALATVVQTTAFAQSFTPGNAHGSGRGNHSSRNNHHDHGHRHGGHDHHRHNHSRTTVRVGVGFYPSSYYYSPYRYPYAYSQPYYGYNAGYRSPAYYDSGYYAPSGSRASTGLILGGIAGAIIGNNSGDLRHDAWRGAAIGAGTGWLLGSIADNRARARENTEPVVVSQPAVATTTAPAQSSVPQTVIINNNYYGTPSAMSSANSMFGR